MFEYLKRYRNRFPDRKFYLLIDKVYDFVNLEDAWKKVKVNKGCAGIDEETLHQFSLRRNLYFMEIQRKIKQQRYKATPVLRKLIPKDKNKFRPLGIPTVKDRVLQQSTKNVLEPIFEMKFKDCSYGFRPNKSAHQAIEKIKEHLNDGFRWVIDADIKGFFDNVDHKTLMKLVNKEVSDGKVLGLIEQWLKAGVMVEGKLEKTEVGTPQGGVISPLLANIYLHELDEELSSMVNARVVRYADDFVILTKTKWMAKRVMKAVNKIVTKLKLELNKEKTRIVNTKQDSFEFLGFVFKYVNNRLRFKPRQKSIEKFKKKVRQVTRRKNPMNTKGIVGRINMTIKGWGNYFKIGEVRFLYKQLDTWIRMRIRCHIEKRISRYSHQRIPNYVLKSEYKLASLNTLIKPRSL